MMAHGWQAKFAHDRVDLGPVLNAACKEDPAKLSKLGVVNLDICTFDKQTKRKISDLPNFVQGSVLEMSSLFPAEHFATIVLGEYLEHCTMEAAVRSLHECRKILKPTGMLGVTFPLDDRPAEAQHGKHLLEIWVEGETGHDITVWHQTVWTDEMLKTLFDETGWEEVRRDALKYGFVKRSGPHGWGIMLGKRRT